MGMEEFLWGQVEMEMNFVGKGCVWMVDRARAAHKGRATASTVSQMLIMVRIVPKIHLYPYTSSQ